MCAPARRMIPDVLHIGPIPIHLFGLFLALAFLAAGRAAGSEFTRRGWDPNLASSVVVWAAVGGIVGARVWLVLAAWPEFVRAPWSFLLTGGGFVFYGGLVGGALAVTIFFRRAGIPWLRGADAVAPAIVLGQAIGRIGCQLAGDGDWGIETTLPWGMAYPHAVVGWDKPPGVRVHPTPVYESLAYFAIFALLWRLRREPAADGSILAGYLVLSGTARFLVEFVRINRPILLGLTEAQLTSLVLIALGTVHLLTTRAWRTAAA
jgi:phosphatidylglycerol:prolipoprotein diacylglycerol transferase